MVKRSSLCLIHPFTDISSNGIGGLFDEAIATPIISLVEIIHHNAEVA